jgi:hypothetical protein
MNNYYVYFLLDPTNFYLPFYIGKGKETRWQDHLTETIDTTLNKRKFYKIKKIRRSGKEPKVMFFAVDLPENEAYTIEDEQILRFGRKGYEPDGILTNICLGARPPGFNNCQDQDAFRKAISLAQTGEKNHFYGKTHTEETKKLIGNKSRQKVYSVEYRKKLSEAGKGKIPSAETKMKMRSAQLGKKKTEAHKQKIGAAHRGKIISQEQREKISEKMSGRKFSPETIEKMKLAAKAREAKKKGLSSED